jgi:hypothetical protein
MERLTRIVTVAFAGAAGILFGVAPATAQGSRVAALSSMQARVVVSGTISGVVSDERGGALGGAMVSVVGVTLASTVTDAQGRYSLNQLPAGDYLVRAHLSGFAASSGALVRVGVSPSVQSIQLRRLDFVPAAVGTSGAPAAPVKTRPIIAAGIELPRGTESEAETGSSKDHPHSETAWRLRHIKRSILKDVGPIQTYADTEAIAPSVSMIERAMDSAASIATSLFTDFPFSGEVNFLTTGAVAPGALLSATAFPRGVAYLALAAPTTSGDWSIRAAMSEGDLSSWIVAGAFSSKAEGAHRYNFGLSYSTQEYQGGNPAALAAVRDGSRNVGELYAFDKWTVARAVTIDYGGRYAHYDYLEQRGLLSPRFAVTLGGSDGARVRATVAQQMVAPGAEEFLSTSAPGPWLPPERTFAPLVGMDGVDPFRVERARTYDVAFERDLGKSSMFGVSRFRQSVDDQLVTLFGIQRPGGPKSIGHYFVATAGSLDANGWALRFDTRREGRFQGSVHYSMTRVKWGSGRGNLDALRAVAPAAIRTDLEDLHDLTTSVKADIPETSTRVFVLYKLNSGFVRSNTALARPGIDGRFDVQVNQSLPLTFAGTKWEVLFGVRNTFRDPSDPASVYDELLVVRPPKRVVGGFLVRF